MVHLRLSNLAPRLIGLAFVAAGVLKLLSGNGAGAAGPVAPTLLDVYVPRGSGWWPLFVGGELLLGAWLISLWLRRVALALAIALLAGFTVLLAGEMPKADPKACGCFITPDMAATISARRGYLGLGIGRNLSLIALGALALRRPRSVAHLQSTIPPETASDEALHRSMCA